MAKKKNNKNNKKKNNSLMDAAVETVGVGTATMTGHLVLGTMAGLPGMPAEAIGGMRTAGAGLNLVNVGQLAKVGMMLPKIIAGETGTSRKKSTGDRRVDKILGR